jgi:hypothetical protein
MGRVKNSEGNKRQAKLESVKREQAKASRDRRTWFILLGVGALAIALIVIFTVKSQIHKTSAIKATVAGVQTFPGLSTKHVSGPVKYAQTPPVGGDHSAEWLNCGVYSLPVPNENAVHSLEHAAVWVTYDPTIIKGDQLTSLRKLIPSTYAILSPYPSLPTPIVASAWGVQLQVSAVNDPRIPTFIAKYRQSKSAPELGSACTGGLSAPGRVS